MINSEDDEAELKEIISEMESLSESEEITVVVHGAVYKHLLLARAALLFSKKMPATIEHAIVATLNEANDLAVLVNYLMRTHPETKPMLVELSKRISQELHERISSMAEVIGSH